MEYPPKEVVRQNTYSKVASITIMVASVGLILAVPIRHALVLFNVFELTSTFIVESLALLVIGFICLAFGVILYKFVGWESGDLRPV